MLSRTKWREGLARLWWWLRQMTGDAAYENYVRRMIQEKAVVSERGVSSCGIELTPEEFYLDRLRRKYSRVNRCC